MLKFRSEIDALNSQGMDIDSFEADMMSFLGRHDVVLGLFKKNETPHNKLSRDFPMTHWSICNIM